MTRCLMVAMFLLLSSATVQAQTIKTTVTQRSMDKKSIFVAGIWDTEGKQFGGIKIFMKKQGASEWDSGTVPNIDFAKKTWDIDYLMVDPNTKYEFKASLYYSNDLMGPTLHVDADVVAEP